MAVAKYDFWGDKDSVTQEAIGLSLTAMSKGYGFEKISDPMQYEPKYGMYRVIGPNRGKVAVGVFDSKEELVAMLKLILASE